MSDYFLVQSPDGDWVAVSDDGTRRSMICVTQAEASKDYLRYPIPVASTILQEWPWLATAIDEHLATKKQPVKCAGKPITIAHPTKRLYIAVSRDLKWRGGICGTLARALGVLEDCPMALTDKYLSLVPWLAEALSVHRQLAGVPKPKAATKTKCSCNIRDLMMHGCTCGGE